MKRYSVCLIGVFLLGLPLLIGAQEAAPKRGGKLTFGIERDISTLLVEARKTTDQKKRYTLYAKVGRILHDDAPELPLVYVPRFFTYNDKVKGFSTDGDGRFNSVSFGLSRVWIDR